MNIANTVVTPIESVIVRVRLLIAQRVQGIACVNNYREVVVPIFDCCKPCRTGVARVQQGKSRSSRPFHSFNLTLIRYYCMRVAHLQSAFFILHSNSVRFIISRSVINIAKH